MRKKSLNKLFLLFNFSAYFVFNVKDNNKITSDTHINVLIISKLKILDPKQNTTFILK